MKKITLLILMIFTSFSGYSQWVEGFESGIPSTWTVSNNGFGLVQNWQVTSVASNVYSGTQAAEVLRENVGAGVTSEDWLVTPLQTGIIANAQLRFFSRSQVAGNSGTLYQIRISSPSATGPTDFASYSVIQEYTELTLSAIASIYEEKVVSLAAYAGTNRYIAFVRVHTQPTGSTSGDKWLLDEVKIAQQCFDPTVLSANNITSTTAVLGWTSTATSFDVQYGPQGFTLGTGTTQTNVANPYTATNLTPATPYQFYVRANCGTGVTATSSAWTGPFNFTTKFQGTVCSDPYIVGALPYQVTNDTTTNYGNNVTGGGTQGTNCGTTPATTNFIAGNDVVYSFTPTFTGPISITLTPSATSSNSSLFVYDSCANIGVNCLAGIANTGNTVRVLNINVTAGQTYIILISSSTTTPTIVYDLLIQREECVPSPSALTATGITTTNALLSWTSPAFTTGVTPSSWQVAVQPLGSAIPTGPGVAASNPQLVTTLTAATQYQYWVRAECSPGSGVFSAWSGPYAFNTAVCEATSQCNFAFRMSASVSGGWNGARMQVRQNGIVVATIGSTFITGLTAPADIIVPLCNGVPFDLYWSIAGTQPQRCKVDILNSFGQTIYSKAAGTGAVGDVLYSETAVNCTTPRCDLPPTALNATLITTTTASLSWTAVATTNWDIYIVPTGNPAPTQNTVPTYANVNQNPFTATNLLPDTSYSFYVRVVCSPVSSTWTGPFTFTTIPTCPKPTGLFVSPGITTTSATFNWTNGTPTDTAWQILLVPTPTFTPPATLPLPNPTMTPGMILANVNAPSPHTIATLTPATIYYYYIRTVCSTNDSSTWAGPFVFNTVTCAAADKCVYKFILTDTGGNGWNTGTMQVRQNGIVVGVIGGSITGAGPTTVNVSLCTNVPFDLYWNNAGTAPAEIGLTIQNPFLDLLYTKLPGAGTPQTVLFSSTANCTPPTCQKPTSLTVTNVTQTTATLGWTQAGTATQWQVYCVPTGTAAPINGSVLSNVAPNFVTSSNPFTFPLNTLTPGTAYTYYVRAICSATDMSTWTLLTPISFITKPINDECAFATPVPVNPAQVCLQNVAGNTLGATSSTPAITGAGCTTTDDDVWFSFVATNTIHMINLNTIVGTPNTVTLNHSVFSGSCASLVNMYCSTTSESVAIGLVVGNTYYVRVYTAGSTAGQSASFNICIKTPPPAATNNECANAIPVTVNLNAVCASVTPGNIIGATASLPASTCVGNANDDVWFSFVATSPIHYISLLNVAGTTTDLNHAVYTGNCGALTLRYCSAANSLISNNNTFVIGQTYYIRVWSNSAASQVTTFNICVKSVSTCNNAAPFCGSSIEDPYIFDNTTGITSTGQIACLFTTPNPAYYTLHVGQTGPMYFNILQNTVFTNGAPTGTNLDVDFVAWGPFTSPQSCNSIVFGPCSPTPCPNNTTNPTFYPAGNVVDCSYSASFTETLSIPNAQAGEYYIILITNFNGAAGFIRLVQTNFSEPTAGSTICCDVSLGPDVSLCATSTTLNALTGIDPANVPTDYIWYFNGVVIPGSNSPTYTATQSGTYKVTALCGLNPVEDTINVVMSPQFFITPTFGPIAPICAGTEVANLPTQSLNGITGTWTPAINNLITTTYTFQPNPGQCGTTAEITIIVNPVLGVTVNNPTVCAGSTATVTATPAIPGNYIYTWTVPSGVPNPGNVASFTTNVQGDYSVVISQADNFCNSDFESPTGIPLGSLGFVNQNNFQCWQTTATDGIIEVWTNGTEGLNAYSGTQFIELNANQISSLYQNFSVIPGTAMNLTFAHRGRNSGTDVMRVEIGPVGGPYINIGQFSATPAAWVYNSVNYVFPNNGVTNYTILFTSVSSGTSNPTIGNFIDAITMTGLQCTSLLTTSTVTVNPIVTPSFTQIPNTCQNTLPAPTLPLFSNDNPEITGSWSGAINTANIGNFTYLFTPTVGQCATTTSMTVSIITEPISSFVYNSSSYCQTGTVTPTPNYLGGGTAGGFSATPSTGLSLDPVTGEIVLATSTPGNYIVTNTIPAGNGCPTASSSATITITSPPVASFSYPASPYCQNTLSTPPTFLNGGVAGIFSSTTGLIISATTGEVNLAASSPGTYIVTNAIAVANGCSAVSATASITITALPIATFNYDANAYCKTGANPVLTYSGGGVAGTFSSSTGLSLNATTGAIVVSTSTPGQYTVTNTIAAASGCPNVTESATIIITAPPVATFSYTATPYCNNATNPTPTFSGGGVAGTFSSTTGLDINSTTGLINLSGSTSGSYIVTNTIAAANGCGAVTATTPITITTLPQATITYSGLFCSSVTVPQSVTLTGATGGIFSAAPSGLSIDATTGDIVPNSSPVGGYTVTYTIAAAGGCPSVSATTQVTIDPEFLVSIIEACEGQIFSLTALPVSNSFVPTDATYEWTGPNGFVSAPSNSPSIVVSTPGNYVSIVNYNGCISTNDHPVSNTTCIIQKGISPNGDGDNESFILTDVKKLSIYNRYGSKVYSFYEYTNQWHGQTDSGSELPDGTYYYVIERGNGDTLTGWIYINR
jgi:gliding motility-associated-like protein